MNKRTNNSTTLPSHSMKIKFNLAHKMTMVKKRVREANICTLVQCTYTESYLIPYRNIYIQIDGLMFCYYTITMNFFYVYLCTRSLIHYIHCQMCYISMFVSFRFHQCIKHFNLFNIIFRFHFKAASKLPTQHKKIAFFRICFIQFEADSIQGFYVDTLYYRV